MVAAAHRCPAFSVSRAQRRCYRMNGPGRLCWSRPNGFWAHPWTPRWWTA